MDNKRRENTGKLEMSKIIQFLIENDYKYENNVFGCFYHNYSVAEFNKNISYSDKNGNWINDNHIKISIEFNDDFDCENIDDNKENEDIDDNEENEIYFDEKNNWKKNNWKKTDDFINSLIEEIEEKKNFDKETEKFYLIKETLNSYISSDDESEINDFNVIKGPIKQIKLLNQIELLNKNTITNNDKITNDDKELMTNAINEFPYTHILKSSIYWLEKCNKHKYIEELLQLLKKADKSIKKAFNKLDYYTS